MSAIVLSTINAKWIHPSLALRLLKANLGFLQNQCTIVEFALRQPLHEKTAAILAKDPHILALSVSIWNHEATLELLAALEEAWSKIEWSKTERAKPVIVLGGPEITGLIDCMQAAVSADVFNDEACGDVPALFNYADFVIRGEGETVFAGLCRAVLEDPAAAKKQYGKYIMAEPVHPAAVQCAYDLYTAEDLQQKLIYVESSRGCPYTCAFCQSAVKYGQQTPPAFTVLPLVREFSLEQFLGNLEQLLQRSAASGTNKKKTIKFLDRSFNIHIPRALSILEFCLAKTSQYNNCFEFHFEIVPAVFPQELKDMLARFPLGSIRLEIGIQSLNQKTCALINRNSNPQKELEVLGFLRENTNALIHADLIAGLPGEDMESFGRGFDQLWALLSGSGDSRSVPFEIQPGILKYLPGTPIHTMAQSGCFAVKYQKTAPYEVIETDCLSVKEMESIKNFARFWELIVNRSPFPGLLPQLAPSGKPVFARFMELSQKLFKRFGKNWGIPKQELEEALLTCGD